VIRVPVYVRWNKLGAVIPDQTVELAVDTPALAVVDGRHGYGQTVAPQAVRIGIEKCKATGLAAVSLRNAGISAASATGRKCGGGRIGIDPFRQRAGSVLVAPYGGSSGGFQQHRFASAFRERAGTDRAGFRHLGRRRGKCWWQAAVASDCRGALIDLDGNQSEIRRAVRTASARWPRDHSQARARSAPSANTRLRARADLRTARRP